MDKTYIEKMMSQTMAGLKDFQISTVERVDYLFQNGQNRVLVADEVGMGKTLIARGTIIKSAWHSANKKQKLFKVVYICSNSAIAAQNIYKLKVTENARVEHFSDTRLSMQHLKLIEQESDKELRESFIQLIPLTPDTSFRMTNGSGTVQERALMYAVLRRMDLFKNRQGTLERFLIRDATNGWQYCKPDYEMRVKKCETASNGVYPGNLIKKIESYNRTKHILDDLVERLGRKGEVSSTIDNRLVNRLRVMFAEISTSMMKPDLVIMDEFQRFKFLLSSDTESETGVLTNAFFKNRNAKILLLSATPYKLYSTAEEIDRNNIDEHYTEFLQVMDFLFGQKSTDFREVWGDYSSALRELRNDDTSIIEIKNKAENAMYRGVCRTERISVMESGDYIDDTSINDFLEISEKDITSYLAMKKLIEETDCKQHLQIDYVKSSPYLMSFMKNYKLKQALEKYFANHLEKTRKAASDSLWIDQNAVQNYKPLPKANARLEKLKEYAFRGNGQLLLWVPPSLPYYALGGPYKGSEDFSKILVFSSWEMVPRMIGSMISYEFERNTLGKLYNQRQNLDRKNTTYNAKRRYPYQRLRFGLADNEPQNMTLFTLLYPSKTLASFYDPAKALSEQMSLSDIEKEVKEKIRKKLVLLSSYQDSSKNTIDYRWYYLAPMLLDGIYYVSKWADCLYETDEDSDEENSDKGNKALYAHLEKCMSYMDLGKNVGLGKMPGDLLNTLTDMVIASPAICIYRASAGNAKWATRLARVFTYYFNQTESTAVVELSAGQFHAKKSDDNSHWQDVLAYCKDGCFQAMIDEYMHIMLENAGFGKKENKIELACGLMERDLRIHTARYDVDTYNCFKHNLTAKGKDRKRFSMRAHYAVGFINEKGENEKSSIRKDSIRGAFNSPLKPFVLATTSIGQEGLDFHNYCRRIVHWNLPSNPIDLEQREGRINRYKCLAIRQNIAKDYGSISFDKDMWAEMFEIAALSKENGLSDLVPYWCFGKNQSVKIERIVPMYPMSKDKDIYDRLIRILSLYRLTLGHGRQEELLMSLSGTYDMEKLKELFMNLSPYSKEKNDEDSVL